MIITPREKLETSLNILLFFLRIITRIIVISIISFVHILFHFSAISSTAPSPASLISSCVTHSLEHKTCLKFSHIKKMGEILFVSTHIFFFWKVLGDLFYICQEVPAGAKWVKRPCVSLALEQVLKVFVCPWQWSTSGDSVVIGRTLIF